MNPLAIAIVHAPWGEGRKESYKRLVESLWREHPHIPPYPLVSRTFTSEGPAPTHAWAEEVYTWAFGQNRDLLVLEDDAILCPKFLDVLTAMREANPMRLMNLYNAHPSALGLAAKGVSAYTTLDWMTGVGQVIPREVLSSYMGWRAFDLRSRAIEHIKADTLLGLYAAASNVRVWHPIPTPVDHDDSLPSLYGNDQSPMRRSLARWDRLPGVDMTSRAYWEPRNPFGASELVHLGRIHPETHYGFTRWVLEKGLWEATADRIERDVVKVVGRS